jgi:tubulin beta
MPSYAPFYDPKAKHFEKNSVAELTKAYAVLLSIIPHLHISTVCSIAKTCSLLVILVLGLSRHLLSHFHTTLTFSTSTLSRYLTAATIFRGDISSREVSDSVLLK